MEDLQQEVETDNHTFVFAQELSDLYSRFSELEKSELSAFQARRDSLQNDIQQLQNQMLSLQQEYATAQKSRKEAYDAEFWKRFNRIKDFEPQAHDGTSASSSGEAQDELNIRRVHEPATMTSSSRQTTGKDGLTTPAGLQQSESQATETEETQHLRRSSRAGAHSRPAREAIESEEEEDVSCRRGLRKRTQTEKAINVMSTRSDEDRGRYDMPTGGPRKKRKIDRTITFADLYRGGKAKYKHMIIRFPKVDGDWFILRCDEHIHFGLAPLKGALKHLGGKYHSVEADYAKAVEILGVQVLQCNEEKAEKNNASFQRALKNGYKPLNATAKPKSASVAHDSQRPDTPPHHHSSSPAPSQDNGKQHLSNTNLDQGSEPSPGQNADLVQSKLCLARWKSSDYDCAALILPLRDFASAGMSGSFADTGLNGYIPVCYTSEDKTISGWADGFEDGGEKVAKRKLPVMYFDDDVDIPLHGNWELPKQKQLYGWISAKFINEFDFSSIDCQVAPGYQSAQIYRDRLANMTPRARIGDTIFARDESEEIENGPSSPVIISISSNSSDVSSDDGHHTSEEHPTSDDEPTMNDLGLNPDSGRDIPDSVDQVHAVDFQLFNFPSSPEVASAKRVEDRDVTSQVMNDDSESHSTSALLEFADEVLRMSPEVEDGYPEPARGDKIALNTVPRSTASSHSDHNSPDNSPGLGNSHFADILIHHQGLAQAALAAVVGHAETGHANPETETAVRFQLNPQGIWEGSSSTSKMTNSLGTARRAPCDHSTPPTTDDPAGKSPLFQAIVPIEECDDTRHTFRDSIDSYNTARSTSFPPANSVDETATTNRRDEMLGAAGMAGQAGQANTVPALTQVATSGSGVSLASPSLEKDPSLSGAQDLGNGEEVAGASQSRSPLVPSIDEGLDRQHLSPPSTSTAPAAYSRHVTDSDPTKLVNVINISQRPGFTPPTLAPQTQCLPSLLPQASTSQQSFDPRNMHEATRVGTLAGHAQPMLTFHNTESSQERPQAETPARINTNTTSPISPNSRTQTDRTLSATWDMVQDLAPLSTPVQQYLENLKSGGSVSNHFQGFFRNTEQSSGGIVSPTGISYELAGARQSTTVNPAVLDRQTVTYEQYATPQAISESREHPSTESQFPRRGTLHQMSVYEKRLR